MSDCSVCMPEKVPLRVVGRQGLILSLALMALGACRHEAARTVLVEPDTTSTTVDAPLGVATNTPTRQPIEEVVVVDTPAPTEAPRPTRATAPALDESGAATDVPAETAVSPEPSSAPDVSAMVVPVGTRIDLVLKTPLHTATTLAGDRFAARLAEDVRVGDDVVLSRGTMVEGRVARVVSAEESDGGAVIDLDFRALLIEPGERVAIRAELTGDPDSLSATPGADTPSGPSRIGAATRGAITGAILGTVLGGGRRGAVIGAVLGSATGAVLVGSSPDRELIVPSDTPLTIVLTAPLELPRAPDRTR